MMKKSALMTVLVLAFFVISGCSNWGKSELNNEKIAVKFAREVLRGGYGIVDTNELKKWIDEKKEMIIVDTMPLDMSYNKNHIPGAVQILFPIPELTKIDDAQKNALIKLLGSDKKKQIVFYCGFTKCTRSHNGALWAVNLGYKNVYRYPAGIVGWKEADFPVEKAE